MKTVILLILSSLFISSCQKSVDLGQIKQEIISTEASFQTMAHDKGIAEAFAHYADENAVIKRENDTLIIGKEAIRNYYLNKKLTTATVTWKPDFVEVSLDGTLAYTYGKYQWKINEDNTIKEYKGVFHTVWKRQDDGKWLYVWD